VSLIIHIMY